jgi:hypothetical protein
MSPLEEQQDRRNTTNEMVRYRLQKSLQSWENVLSMVTGDEVDLVLCPSSYTRIKGGPILLVPSGMTLFEKSSRKRKRPS